MVLSHNVLKIISLGTSFVYSFDNNYYVLNWVFATHNFAYVIDDVPEQHNVEVLMQTTFLTYIARRGIFQIMNYKQDKPKEAPRYIHYYTI